MTFREQCNKPDWDDWTLAREAVWLRCGVRYSPNPQVEAAQQIQEAFTADEARRIDAYLAAATPDTGRLAAIEARLDDASDDTKWLVEQLRIAWADLDELRDRIDDSGSLMHTVYAASAIRYVTAAGSWHEARSAAPASAHPGRPAGRRRLVARLPAVPPADPGRGRRPRRAPQHRPHPRR